jgi:CHAT domain-containing protein/Flp pilus assembly protein TadD
MDTQPEEENTYKWYLLGATLPEEDDQIEQRLRNEKNYDELLLAEEELIDDYARGMLAPYERDLFEQNFLTTQERHTKLLMAQAAVRYAAKQPLSAQRGLIVSIIPAVMRLGDWNPAFVHYWKVATCAALALVVGLGIFRGFRGESDVVKGLAALSDAFREQRPTEARITGFAYAVSAVTRGGSARNQTNLGDYRHLDDADSLLRAAARDNENGETLHALGNLYLAKRDFDKSIEQLEKALTYNPIDSRIHSDLGAALLEKLKNSVDQNKGDPKIVDKAFSHIKKALELDGDLLEALFNRALLYQLQNLSGPAIEAWKKYLEKDSGSKWAEEANFNLKELQLKSSNSGEERYESLYRDFLQARVNRDENNAWRLYNDSYHRSGNYITDKLIDEFLAFSTTDKQTDKQQDAEERIRTVEYIGRLSQQKSGDRFISQLASVYRHATDEQREMLAEGRRLRQSAFDLSFKKASHQEAIESYLKAKALFTRAQVPPEVVTVEYWIAESYLRLANHDKSLQSFLSIAETCERQRYRWMRALTFNRIAAVLGDQFSYSKAIKYCIEAADEFIRIGDRSGHLRVLMNQAGIYRYMGKYREAIELCQSSLILAKEVAAADNTWVHVLYGIACWSYCRLGLYSAALEFQNELLRMVEALNKELDSSHLAISRYSVFAGQIYSRLKEYDAAISSIERALNLGREREDSAVGQDMINFARLYLGQVYREAGKPAEAMKAHEQAAEYYRKRGWDVQSYLIAKEILLDKIAMEDTSSASRQLDIVLELLEEHRKKILQQSNRNSFFEMEQPVYDIAISFAHETLGQPEQAFNYSELSRARTLLDSATLTTRIIKDIEIPEEVLSGSTRPMTLAEIQPRIPIETQILQYAVLKDRIVAWVVTRERIESRTIMLEAEQLSAKVKAYLNLVSKPATEVDQSLREMSSELYENLIAPVEKLFDKKRRLCIVPDKILNFLPYSALISPRTGGYLIADYSLLFAPSSTLFIRSTENADRLAGNRAERLLSVGNPAFDQRIFDLPNLSSAGDEARAIKAIYGSGISLVGKDANKFSLLREVERSDVVHLAMHYVTDERSPMLSRLILAGGSDSKEEAESTLPLHEVYRLKLSKARLVVLSACQTKAEQYYDGEGSIGLSHAFESVGVPLVVSSLWQADSDMTEKLMVRFHSLRKMAGESTVNALRIAQIEMLNSKDKRQHPYYWAAFIASGGYSRF